jgi:cell shape-determining protein MreD
MRSRLVCAVAAGLTALLLQATVVGPVTFPVAVSLPALLVIILGICAGPGIGLGFGFALGLLADLGSGHPAGVLALAWMGAGAVGGIVGGLVIERGCRARGIAASAALLATLASLVSGLALVILDSHAASLSSVFRDLVPTFLLDAIGGLIVVPLVRAVLQAQRIAAPRPVARIIGRPYAAR